MDALKKAIYGFSPLSPVEEMAFLAGWKCWDAEKDQVDAFCPMPFGNAERTKEHRRDKKRA